ncbi:MAG: ABC transporter substrate-binding protein [Candidatus Rokubacteria bacterium]|nr:ABC transporter substrate-binding protein [Candidatus Rokubacteria bacterium]
MLGVILLVQALTVAVGGAPGSPAYLPLRVAETEGYFTREGLTVTLRAMRAESGAAEALAQGQADLAATSLQALLRFGHRQGGRLPRLVFGLTAAPHVAVLVGSAQAAEITSVADLAGARIGFTTPGGAEQTWVAALLARARLAPAQVEMISLGSRGVATALDTGEVRAAAVPEPAASALVDGGRAAILADLRSPRAVSRALGMPTVHAAVFARADRRIGDRELAAFGRALLAAQRRIATAPPAELAERLPRSVVGLGDDFARRVEASRSLYLPDGLVDPDAVRATIEIIRAHVALPAWLRLPRPEQMLHLEPLRRSLRSKRPA